MTILSDELANDPLTRGYSGMSDIAAAASLNTVNRDLLSSPINALIEYLFTNKNRTNTGTDTVGTNMLGRLATVSESSAGVSPFGATADIDNDMIHAAKGFYALIQSPIEALDFLAVEVDNFFTDLVNAGVWKNGDVTNIKALVQGKQSRAMELGLKKLKTYDITEAR